MANKKITDIDTIISINDTDKIVMTETDTSVKRIPYANLMKSVNDKIKENTEQLNENTQKNSDFITPEMYGAKGDGVTDDTSAIQQAFDYCKTNGLICKFISGKTYCISSTLEISGLFHVEFNNAWIKTITPITYGIEINITDDNLNTAQCYFKKLNLNCENIGTGIKVTKAKRIFLENSLIRNCQQVGLQLDDGYEITVSHCNFTGIGATNKAIVINTTDNYIHHCFGINNNKFIENNADGNIFESNHAWIMDKNILTNSIFIDLKKDGLVSNCVSDTYCVGFQCSSTGASRIIGNSVIINTTYYNKSTCTVPPTFISFTGNSYVYNATIGNNWVSFPDKSITGFDIHGNLYNIPKKNVCCNVYGNNGYNIAFPNYTKVKLTNGILNKTTRESYAIRKGNRVNATIYFSGDTIPTTDTIAVTIPEYLRPFNGFYHSFTIGNDLNSLSAIGYGYVDSNGNVIIKNSTGVTTFSQGVMNVSYDIWETGIASYD